LLFSLALAHTKGPCWLIIQIPQSRNSWQLEPRAKYFLSLCRSHACTKYINAQTRSLLLMLLGGGFFTFSVDDTYIKCFMAVCALCCVISFFFCGAGKFSRSPPLRWQINALCLIPAQFIQMDLCSLCKRARRFLPPQRISHGRFSLHTLDAQMLTFGSQSD
jgi:hypothetical protein